MTRLDAYTGPGFGAEDGWGRREGLAGADAARPFEHHAGHLPAIRVHLPASIRFRL
jgi:hypothetical protein